MQKTSADAIYWLAATRFPGIGPVTFKLWLSYFSNIQTLFSASFAELKEIGLTNKEIHVLKNPNWKVAEQDILWSQQPNCYVLTQADKSYPELLRQLPDAPLVLYVQGYANILSTPQIAMVGSRHPTHGGIEMADDYARCLAQAGLWVTSGLALGIDTASHLGALKANCQTIAVLGSGLNQIYPRSNQKLAEQIIRQGALVSEFPLDMPPHRENFPRRNRIISGLSLGVVVIEAAIRSGSLITARFAAEQGREVFAIPGSIHNPLARGCHQLIREGAKLIENASDILEELGPLRGVSAMQSNHSSPLFPGKPMNRSNESTVKLEVDNSVVLEPKQREFLIVIDHSVTTFDSIIMRSGLTASEVSSMLLSLELRNYVRVVPGGYIRTPLGI